MPGVAPRLDGLPLEVLQQIAAFCDEKTVWQLAATSKWIRSGGTMALRKFLRVQTVRVRPPWVVNIHTPFSRSFAPITTQPRDPSRPFRLQQKNNFFESHLNIHPLSTALLRDLTVEILDSEPSAGWRQITKFAPQLTHLRIHMLDAQWCITGDWREPLPQETNPRFVHGLLIKKVWPKAFRLSKVKFPHLTHLDLVVTARMYSHFIQIAPCVPDLLELRLSCQDANVGDVRSVGAHRFDRLVSLTLTGFAKMVLVGLDDILSPSTSIRYLTIRLALQKYMLPILEYFALDQVCGHLPLLGLALYGPHSIGLLHAFQMRQITYINFPFLPNLAVLAFERPTSYTEDPDDDDFSFPLIAEERLNLPKLERLVVVDERHCPTGPQHVEVVTNNIFVPSPTFQRVVRVAAYPKDPFAADLESVCRIVMMDRDPDHPM